MSIYAKGDKKLLIVDVCDTLYPVNTTMGFIDACIPSRSWRIFSFIKRLFIVKALNVVVYKVLKVDVIRAVSVAFLKGMSREALNSKARLYVDSLPIVEPVKREIEQRRSEQWDIALASASLEPVVSSICKKFQLEHYLSSELEYDESGVCLGRIASDALDNKTKYVEGLSKAYAYVAFITDNKGDANCMGKVDEFIAVVPSRNKESVSYWNEKKADRIIEL